MLITTFVAYAVLNQVFGFVEPLNESGARPSVNGPAAWALCVTYAPLIARGPLLAILTVAYHRRRRANEEGGGEVGDAGGHRG
ncbi:hypothetical protein ACFYXP_15860 [Streptomyces sp. NPDC002466]|uniref:hypothetical protein n=1 Tax=unclassified Streptomyces TaxID=2593676 RepID=UPI00292A41FA|nr:hypothetical protein [Streptomyces sp. sk2.1]